MHLVKRRTNQYRNRPFSAKAQRLGHFKMRLKFFVLCLGLLASPSLADEPYRLVPGDRVVLSYNFLQHDKTAEVDLDGNIRLLELGNIPAAGETFDEVQNHIISAMLQGGFSGIPSVSVEIASYAPVIVSGFVERGGLYDYVPNMTVGVALAISGGVGSSETPNINVDIAALNAQRRSLTLAEQIARNVAQIARLEAAISSPTAEVELSTALRVEVPRQEISGMVDRLAVEAKILRSERQTSEVLLATWEKEIKDSQRQIELLDERAALKADVIANISKDLDAARSLQSQGLATNTRTSALIQRLADEREDLLAIETAKVNVSRSKSGAERNSKRYVSDLHQSHLEELRDVRNDLARIQRDYRFALNEVSLLNSEGSSLPILEGLSLSYSLQGPRVDRIAQQDIDSNTLLLPGDILVVEALLGADEG